MEIKKGQSSALIDASGAGKTTLADIILGLLRPQKGTVLMDEIDVYVMPKTWAKIVEYVPQSIFLMDNTLRNNIAFSLPEDCLMAWTRLPGNAALNSRVVRGSVLRLREHFIISRRY